MAQINANPYLLPSQLMRVALYQPDIAQNTGTILRMCACFGVGADVIEPAGFDLSDRALKRAGLDYLHAVDVVRFESFEAFLDAKRGTGARVVLLSTKAATPYFEHRYQKDDVLLLGRESAGVPDEVRAAVDCSVLIPMRQGLRSLNVAVAAGIVLGELLRQTGGFAPVS